MTLIIFMVVWIIVGAVVALVLGKLLKQADHIPASTVERVNTEGKLFP